MNRFIASKPGWGRRLVGASAVGAVVAALSLAGVPSALAANDYLEFSLDGTKYAPSITGPIFKESLQYVPGDSTEATIWIRNNSRESAWLSTAAVMIRSDPQLNKQLGLTAGQKPALSARMLLGAEGTCTNVAEVGDLDPGEELELSFVLDLSMDAPNNAMNRSADFDLVFLLESQDVAPRQACAALAGSGQPPAGSAPAPGRPGPTAVANSSPQFVTLSGIPGDRPLSESNPIYSATLPERTADRRSPQSAVPTEQQPGANIIQAGFQSTVEPIIRSLSGTLLIAMSVLFTAAVVLRLRNRSANE